MPARRILFPVLCLVLAAVVVMPMAGKRAQARLAAQYPPIGQLVDVGGYRLHLYCLGEGSPAVIFDGGAGFAPGLALAHLQQAAAQHTRACIYDRAGQGWSDPSPRPRTSTVIAEELHTLLVLAGEPAPYVLVGWSYGALNMRLYAYNYANEVAGLVLVDGSHERQFEALGGRPSPALMAVFGAIPGLIATGVPALVPQVVPMVDGGTLPAEAAHAARALTVMSPKMAEAALAEMLVIDASMAEVAAARSAAPSEDPLGALPLVVLMKGQVEPIAGVSLSADEQQWVWLELQQDLAQQSSQGQFIVAERSGHNIPYSQPELVVAAIEQVLQASEAYAR